MSQVALNASPYASQNRPVQSDQRVHVVQRGDTLSDIARANGVSLDALIAANPQIRNPHLIRPGQEVTIPSGGSSAPTQSYVVQRGDTLSAIGDRFGVDWRILAQLNGLSNPNLIRPGQEIRFAPANSNQPPASPSAPAPAAPPAAGAPAAATGALPDTAGMSDRERYDLYASYVNTYGSEAARADLAAGRQVILGLRDPSSLAANGGKGAYDDRVVLLDPSNGSVREFTANTEPSTQYEGRYGADANGDGRRDLGRIAEGTVAFTRDRSANLGDVLRPTGSHAIERDVNHDGRIADGEGRGTAADRSFLFHAGGRSNTGSAGCQTMAPDDYGRFWNALDGGQSRFNYVLVNVDRQGPPGAPAAPGGGGQAGAPAAGGEIGRLSERYETGGAGPGTVSTGRGDRGGVSYGSYQLASNMGRPQQFLATEGARWAGEFAGQTPGGQAFSDTWRRIAAREPDAFGRAQHDYIQRTHYQAQADHVRQATGVDVTDRSAALRDVVWSTAVQHGPQNSVIVRAIANLEARGVRPDSADYDRALINAIYDERGRTNGSGGLVYFSGNSAEVQRSVANRFVAERRDALAMLDRER